MESVKIPPCFDLERPKNHPKITFIATESNRFLGDLLGQAFRLDNSGMGRQEAAAIRHLAVALFDG